MNLGGVKHILKNLGFDPDIVMKTFEDIHGYISSVDKRLKAIEEKLGIEASEESEDNDE